LRLHFRQPPRDLHVIEAGALGDFVDGRRPVAQRAGDCLIVLANVTRLAASCDVAGSVARARSAASKRSSIVIVHGLRRLTDAQAIGRAIRVPLVIQIRYGA
jgi:hypothetical protein